jgi:hypothetical protein
MSKQRSIIKEQSYLEQLTADFKAYLAKCCPKKQKSTPKEDDEESLSTINGELSDLLQSLSEKERLEKAVRHFYDGYLA